MIAYSPILTPRPGQMGWLQVDANGVVSPWVRVEILSVLRRFDPLRVEVRFDDGSIGTFDAERIYERTF